MREVPRRRREVSPALAATLSPLFRYSTTRNAYILRGIGQRRGPVLCVRTGAAPRG